MSDNESIINQAEMILLKDEELLSFEELKYYNLRISSLLYPKTVYNNNTIGYNTPYE